MGKLILAMALVIGIVVGIIGIYSGVAIEKAIAESMIGPRTVEQNYISPGAYSNEGISITVYVSSSCHWCDKLKEDVLQHPTVVKALQGVKIVYLNLNDTSMREVVRAVPAVYFYKNGIKVRFFVGYIDKEKFLEILYDVQSR
jgi:thioredoxin-related protein